MNSSQIYGILRIVLPSLIGLATHYLGADAVSTVGSVMATIVAAGGWSAAANTTSSLTETVAATKGSDGQPAVKVLVAPTAPKPLLDLATDTSVPEVVHAASVVPSAPPPKDPYQTSRRAS
jgi:hypothetical protein